MQCKDIDDLPILELVAASDDWANNSFEDERDVRRAFPDGFDTPRKLVLAKMKSLIRRGLITGCTCGCRGDYEITDAGRALTRLQPPHNLDTY